MDYNKMARVMVKVWFVIATLTTVFSLVIALMEGFYKTRIFFLFCGLAWGIFFIRRGSVKRVERHDAAKEIGRLKKEK